MPSPHTQHCKVRNAKSSAVSEVDSIPVDWGTEEAFKEKAGLSLVSKDERIQINGKANKKEEEKKMKAAR